LGNAIAHGASADNPDGFDFHGCSFLSAPNTTPVRVLSTRAMPCLGPVLGEIASTKLIDHGVRLEDPDALASSARRCSASEPQSGRPASNRFAVYERTRSSR
jgi:hypothetical protein